MWGISYDTWIASQPSRDQAHYRSLALNEGGTHCIFFVAGLAKTWQWRNVARVTDYERGGVDSIETRTLLTYESRNR